MGHFDEPKKTIKAKETTVDRKWKIFSIYSIIVIAALIIALILTSTRLEKSEDYAYQLCTINNDVVSIVNQEGELIEECYNQTITKMNPMDCTVFE